jgi:hypothetical protein
MSKSSDAIDLIKGMLDRPIAFNPIFKRITGSTEAALFLSQAWYWSLRTKSKDGYFYKTIREWEEETGLTRKEQDRARILLRNMLIIKTKVQGCPPTTFYFVDHACVYQQIQFVTCRQIEFVSRSTNRVGLRRQNDIPYGDKSICPTGAKLNKESESTTEITQRLHRGIPPAKNSDVANSKKPRSEKVAAFIGEDYGK